MGVLRWGVRVRELKVRAGGQSVRVWGQSVWGSRRSPRMRQVPACSCLPPIPRPAPDSGGRGRHFHLEPE